jgi:hypothetical protein
MVLIQNKLKKNYEIQKRVYQDTNWYNHWFRGMEDKWGEWETFAGNDELKDIYKLECSLNEQKTKLKWKVEYRIIKN